MYKAKNIRILIILLQDFQVDTFCFWKKVIKQTKPPKHNLDFQFLTNPNYFLAPGEN